MYIKLYMLATAGQTATSNWLIIFDGTHIGYIKIEKFHFILKVYHVRMKLYEHQLTKHKSFCH